MASRLSSRRPDKPADPTARLHSPWSANCNGAPWAGLLPTGPHRPEWRPVTRLLETGRIEATIGRLKDFHRIATRYEKLARILLDTVTRPNPRLLAVIEFIPLSFRAPP